MLGTLIALRFYDVRMSDNPPRCLFSSGAHRGDRNASPEPRRYRLGTRFCWTETCSTNCHRLQLDLEMSNSPQRRKPRLIQTGTSWKAPAQNQKPYDQSTNGLPACRADKEVALSGTARCNTSVISSSYSITVPSEHSGRRCCVSFQLR
jgi:hypothetical protein